VADGGRRAKQEKYTVKDIVQASTYFAACENASVLVTSTNTASRSSGEDTGRLQKHREDERGVAPKATVCWGGSSTIRREGGAQVFWERPLVKRKGKRALGRERNC